MTIFCRMRWAQLAAGLVALALLSAQAPAPEPMPNLAVPATAAIAPQAPAGYETITFKSKAADGATVTGYLKRPASAAPTQPTPAIVALHGCNGLFTSKGALTPLNRDWVQRFNGLGYAVLLVDSFNPRGFRDVCRLTASERTVRPFDRARDAAAAVAWLATDAAIDRQRIALIGWSHGGSTVLWAADKRLAFGNADIKAAIAFYPGCRVPAESANWAPRVALPS